MGLDLSVDGEVLRRHTARVQQVVDDLVTAEGAADSTDLGGGAFGVVCGFIAPIALLVGWAARDALSSAREATDGLITEVEAVAASFDEADRQVEEEAKSLLAGLSA